MAHTVRDAIAACGIDNNNLFDGRMPAQRIATDMFDDEFQSCLDKTNDEIDADIKTYSSLTQLQGQIRLQPGHKKGIRAFVQWSKDLIRVGADPTVLPFDPTEIPRLIRRAKEHAAFVKKSTTLTDTAKPTAFKSDQKWTDWQPVFRNFLRSIPGRNGIPLSYVIRDNDNAIIDPNVNMFDDYINRAPLNGEAFDIDSAEVHTYIVNFISTNNVAEAKILGIAEQRNGREDYIRLRDHYEGVGIYAIAIKEADKVIENLIYNGEKKPQMWWEEFEKRLTQSFDVYDRTENRVVYSEEMKLRILCRKVNADFLQNTRQIINVELTRTPMTMTYNQALTTFRNEVNSKFPPSLSATQRYRRVAETERKGGRFGGRGGRGRFGRGRGRGRLGGRDRGRGRGATRRPLDTRYITATDGQTMEVHASFKFSDEDWNRLPREERNRIIQERQQYHANKRQRQSAQQASVISEITRSVIGELRQGATINQRPQEQDNDDNAGTVATDIPRSIMGGRNEQANLRQQRNNTNN